MSFPRAGGAGDLRRPPAPWSLILWEETVSVLFVGKACARLLVLLAAVALALPGCAAWNPRSNRAREDALARVAGERPRVPAVVASWKGGRVERGELEVRARALLAMRGLSPAHPKADSLLLEVMAREGRNLPRLKLLEQYAAEKGVEVSAGVVETTWRRAYARGGGRRLIERLRAWGVTAAELRRELKRELVFQELVYRFAEEARRTVVTEAAVRAQFEQNRELYKIPEQVKLSGIIVRTREEAEQLRNRLLAGAPLGELARRHSIDASAARGGQLGWMPVERLAPWVAANVRGVGAGQVAPVFRGPPGYYVVRVEARKAGRLMTYSEAAPLIQRSLALTEGEARVRDLVARLAMERGLRLFYATGAADPGYGRRRDVSR